MPIGKWHAGLQINDTLELPFTFTSEMGKIIIHNGEENIFVDEIKINGDSVFLQMPVFDSEFRCKLTERSMTGVFLNHARKTHNIFPFHAEYGLPFRFSDKPERTTHNISGRYRVIFDGEEAESKEAVGIFNQDGNHLSATFLTTTGDYRFLEGEVSGNRFWLSAFDGSHLFLFSALIKDDSLYQGEFFSGRHWHDTWAAKKNDNAKLLSADSLTFLKAGFEKIDFKFPDENGKLISLSDERFKNKAVIIQLMGSWCPNCMDETKFLSGWYNNERKKDVEIIALDYERITDTVTAFKNIRRLIKQYDIRYTILYAGSSDKKEAAQTLPMLNRIFAYPTTIFLNKEKKIVKIHSGFNGPATGVEYDAFQKWFHTLIKELTN